jgi:hypothetical protein
MEEAVIATEAWSLSQSADRCPLSPGERENRWPRQGKTGTLVTNFHMHGPHWPESALDYRRAPRLIFAVIATKPIVAGRKNGTHRRWTFEELNVFEAAVAEGLGGEPS